MCNESLYISNGNSELLMFLKLWNSLKCLCNWIKSRLPPFRCQRGRGPEILGFNLRRAGGCDLPKFVAVLLLCVKKEKVFFCTSG